MYETCTRLAESRFGDHRFDRRDQVGKTVKGRFLEPSLNHHRREEHMTEEQMRELKNGIIAMLTVLLQIKNGDSAKIEEGHIAAAQNLLAKVGGVLDDDEDE
jgi:hypothetical protein